LDNVIADPANAKIVDQDTIPQDRTFRKAWKVVGEAIDTDLPIAREVQKDRIRERREPKMKELDIRYMRAIEAGDDEERIRIAGTKQKLRDATKKADDTSITNLDTLKNAGLSDLEI
jgi:hypothetical protein